MISLCPNYVFKIKLGVVWQRWKRAVASIFAPETTSYKKNLFSQPAISGCGIIICKCHVKPWSIVPVSILPFSGSITRKWVFKNSVQNLSAVVCAVCADNRSNKNLNSQSKAYIYNEVSKSLRLFKRSNYFIKLISQPILLIERSNASFTSLTDSEMYNFCSIESSLSNFSTNASVKSSGNYRKLPTLNALVNSHRNLNPNPTCYVNESSTRSSQNSQLLTQCLLWSGGLSQSQQGSELNPKLS